MWRYHVTIKKHVQTKLLCIFLVYKMSKPFTKCENISCADNFTKRNNIKQWFERNLLIINLYTNSSVLILGASLSNREYITLTSTSISKIWLCVGNVKVDGLLSSVVHIFTWSSSVFHPIPSYLHVKEAAEPSSEACTDDTLKRAPSPEKPWLQH